MNRIAKLLPTLAIAANALAFAVSGAVAAPIAAQPEAPGFLVLAQADCYAVGERVAEEMGGKLANVSAKGDSCIVTVVIPGQDGQPPRRERVVVPAN